MVPSSWPQQSGLRICCTERRSSHFRLPGGPAGVCDGALARAANAGPSHADQHEAGSVALPALINIYADASGDPRGPVDLLALHKRQQFLRWLSSILSPAIRRKTAAGLRIRDGFNANSRGDVSPRLIKLYLPAVKEGLAAELAQEQTTGRRR